MIGLNPTRVDVEWPTEATHIRLWDIGVAWCEIHHGPGQYDWTRLDELVERCGDRHVTYVVAGTPRWLARDPNAPHAAPWLGPGSNSTPWSVDAFEQFMKALVRRYRGRIDAYEIGNEPQLVDFLHPYDNASVNALATMTQRAYAVVRRHDSAAMTLAASVLPRASSGGMTRARRWLDALERKGWPIDAFTTHIYPEVGQGVQRWAAMLQDVVSTLAARRPPTRRLWITETTFGLLGPGIPEAQAAALAAGAMDAAGGRFVHWYAWDRPDLGGLRIGPDSAAWAALVTREKGARRDRTA